MYFKNSETEMYLNKIWNNEVVAPHQAIVHLLQYYPGINASDMSQLITQYCTGIIEIINTVANCYSKVKDKRHLKSYLIDTKETVLPELSEFIGDYRIGLLLTPDYAIIGMLMALQTSLHQLNPRRPQPIDFCGVTIQQEVDFKADDDLVAETPLNSFFSGNTFDTLPSPVETSQSPYSFFPPIAYGRSAFVEQARLFSNPPVGLDRDLLQTESYDESLSNRESDINISDDEFERLLYQI